MLSGSGTASRRCSGPRSPNMDEFGSPFPLRYDSLCVVCKTRLRKGDWACYAPEYGPKKYACASCAGYPNLKPSPTFYEVEVDRYTRGFAVHPGRCHYCGARVNVNDEII